MTDPYLLSRRIRRVCLILMWLSISLCLAYLAMAVSQDMIQIAKDAGLDAIDEEHRTFIKPSPTKTMFLTTIATIQAGNNLLIFGAMVFVFYKMSKGQVFALDTVKSIRVLGFMILLNAIIKIASYPLMVRTWTYDNPDGHRLFYISLSTHEMMLLLLGGLFLVIGHIYTQAVRIAEDNRQYV